MSPPKVGQLRARGGVGPAIDPGIQIANWMRASVFA